MVERSPAEGLESILACETERIPRSIENYLYRRKKVRLGSVLMGLACQASVSAIHSYFIEGNLDKFKQNCYLTSRLSLASIGQDGGASLNLGGELLYGMLSDNKEVIDALARAETSELLRGRNNPITAGFHVHMVQLALRDEHDALLAKIEKVAKNGRKPERAESAAGDDFFSLLLKRDKDGLERLIQTRSALIRSSDASEEHFLAFLGALQTKLCWIKGIPVQIDSPLVPMALMPVRPLEGVNNFV
jgi:hypothetical protein